MIFRMLRFPILDNSKNCLTLDLFKVDIYTKLHKAPPPQDLADIDFNWN